MKASEAYERVVKQMKKVIDLHKRNDQNLDRGAVSEETYKKLHGELNATWERLKAIAAEIEAQVEEAERN